MHYRSKTPWATHHMLNHKSTEPNPAQGHTRPGSPDMGTLHAWPLFAERGVRRGTKDGPGPDSACKPWPWNCWHCVSADKCTQNKHRPHRRVPQKLQIKQPWCVDDHADTMWHQCLRSEKTTILQAKTAHKLENADRAATGHRRWQAHTIATAPELSRKTPLTAATQQMSPHTLHIQAPWYR